jgi:hypothetical protein
MIDISIGIMRGDMAIRKKWALSDGEGL